MNEIEEIIKQLDEEIQGIEKQVDRLRHDAPDHIYVDHLNKLHGISSKLAVESVRLQDAVYQELKEQHDCAMGEFYTGGHHDI